MCEFLYKDFWYFRLFEWDIGLRDVLRKIFKVKEFCLGDVLVYLYMRDMRFFLFMCLILGFVLWWCFMLELFVLKLDVLKVDNLG